MPLDDNDLILRAQRGDQEAFEELVYRYDRRVLGIAMRFTGDREAARDIYQEVFLKVHAALPRFRFESRFSTWLYRIAANACLTYKANQRHQREVPLDGERLVFGEAPSGESRTPPQLVGEPDSMSRTLSREIAVRLRRGLALLSPQQRLVFVLRHFEGRKLREIAEYLQCAEGTVKKHLFCGTQRLREQLRELY